MFRMRRTLRRHDSIATHAHRECGFTLMEMVVSVFVVSVMVGVLMPHLLGAGQRAERTACEANQRTIRAALAEYYLLNHTYPSGDAEQQLQSLVDAQLLTSIPQDPGGGTYIIDETDPNHIQVSCSVHGVLGDGS